MSTTALYRWAAAAVVLSAVSMTVGGALHPPVEAASITTPQWAVAHVLWWLGTVLGMLGLVALYLRQQQAVGVLGFLGAGLAWVGTAVLSGAMFFEGIVEPTLLAGQPDLVAGFPGDESWRPFMVAVLAAGVLLGMGFLIFGATMLRAAVLPRWAIVLVMVGAPIQGVSALLPRPIAALGGFSLGVGLTGLGYGLWVSTAAADPATAQVSSGYADSSN